MRTAVFRILPLLLVLLIPLAAAAEEAAAPEGPAPVPVSHVLVAGPVPLHLPAFHDADRAGVEWTDLLAALPAQPGDARPAARREFSGPDGKSRNWYAAESAEGHYTFASSGDAAARWIAFYIHSDRWQTVTLTAHGDHPLKGAVNGEGLKFNKKDGEEDAPAAHTATADLAIGRHLVVLRTMHTPEDEGDWTWRLEVTAGGEDFAIATGIEPEHHVDIQTVLNAPRVANAAVSPDGALVALSLGEYRNGSDHERWVEIRDVESGRLVNLWRGGHAPGQLQWHPAGQRLTWRVDTGDKASLHTFDLESGATKIVLADVEKLGGWQWAPDGQSIVYAISRDAKKDDRKVKRVHNPADRQSWWRNRSHLEQVFVPGGLTRRLTAGPVSANGWDFSPAGDRLLFFTSEQDLTARPYFTSTLHIMDLATLETEVVLTDPWVGGAEWSPDGHKLLLRGSPSAFDGLGRNLPDGVQANDYGGQLYLYDLATGTPTALTVDLQPDVSWAAWSKADGMIYARCTDTQFVTIWRQKPGKDWERVDTGVEACSQIALAHDARVAVTRGSGSTNPNTVHAVDLKKNSSELLLDPGAAWYRDVVFGKVEPWVATLDKGMDLDGFVYYPPGFDPGREYPVIVYYYGGTAPIDRSFGGRYPKNVWAGQDYVVYVPNPSGATGYGQEFAARHVNDWGILTAPEVIEGTEKFLAAHPFADPERVGCMGASYGGFLTMYITTQTDLFAAAVSHAGISDISSYWGEGLWGYAYGARALAGAFPWADQDLYIGQSSLFQADKITTPLLLVSGDSDVNVPKGESDQLFTALKMLGKEVEYVQVVGQDHHIVDHDQRIVWNDTILAFLAKHLKGRTEWWDAMYPEPEDWR